MKIEPNISEQTKIIMFIEYARLVLTESAPTNWQIYNFNDIETRPKEYGRYEVYRENCNKQHYDLWMSNGWASNNNDITHYRVIKPPTPVFYK